MPRWRELKRFCDEDGSIRMTKVSKGSGEIHTHMWKEILKKQLKVTQEYFNKHI